MPPLFKCKPIGCFNLLSAVLIAAIYANLVSKSESVKFAADDFQVKARAIFIDDQSKSPISRLYTSELYSARARAGRVHSEQLSGKNIALNVRSRRSFYYTDKLSQNTFLQVAKYDPECRLIDSARLAMKLFGSLDMDNSRAQQLKLPNLLMMLPIDNDAEARHVFGLARLLLFFEQSRAEFQPHDPNSTSYLRNTRVNEFTLSFRTPSQADVEMLIKVPADANHQKDILGDRLPMRVSLKLPDRAQLVVDFDQVKLFEPDRTSFNLPVGRGCSQWLIGTTSDGAASRGGQTNAHPADVFSFKFELHKMNTSSSASSSAHIQSSFVAYDGQSGLMRVESMQLSDGRPRHELTLTDLNLGLKFHVSGARSQTRRALYLLDSASGSGSSSSSASQPICSKTKVSKLELLPCERIVPPASSMAKMGASEVRGVECLVFESRSLRLPRMIFEPVGWLEKKREKVAYDLSAAVYSIDSNDTTSIDKRFKLPDYRLVYHLAAAAAAADDAEQPGRLLRLDVYDSEASHKYQVEVYNFQWRLTEGPNGDSQRDLFTLDQRCESPETWRHLTEMQLELRPAANQKNNVDSNNGSQTSTALAMAKLSHSPTRQSELIRGVSEASASISGSQILQASSQVVAGKLRASLKLVPSYLLSGPPLIRVLSIGLGQVESGTGHSLESYSFSECFWEAAAMSSARADGQVADTNDSSRFIGVFSFCFERCWIDPEAKLETSTELKDGHKFELISDTFRSPVETQAVSNQRPACQLFALKQQVSLPVADSTSSWPVELQLDEWRSQLENKTIKLAGEPFQVARVHLGLISTGPNELEDEFGGSEFEGVAFSYANNKADLDNVWRAAKQVDSLEHCRSQCVANSTCHSYSFCLQPNGQIECLLASYDLFDGQIRAGLRSRLAKIGQTRSFSLPVGVELESIEFRVSKRCRLVAKLALDLFKRNDELKFRAGQIYVAQIRPVSSQEQCAELCLKSNANFFKRLGRFQVELEVPSGGWESSQVVNKSLELYDRHLDTLRYWCDRYKFLSLKGNSKRARDLREQFSRLGSRELREKIDQKAAFGLCYLARGKWARSDAGASKKAGGGQPSDGAAGQTGGGGGSGSGKPARDGLNSSSVAAARSEQKVVTIEMDTFEFRYSVLYQPQAGLKLVGSKSGEPEVGGSKLKSVNAQTILEDPKDLDLCARSCFTQSIQWCRSFDVIHANSSAFYCVLNSFSLREALRVADGERDLVEARQEVNSTLRFEHFEPLDGYTLDIVRLKVQEADKDEGDEQGEAQEGGQTEGPPSKSNRLPTVCTLAGLIAGLALAVLVVIGHDKRQQRLVAASSIIPEVNLARLSFSLPADDSGKSSLLSQDQLEIRHQAEERVRD